MSGRLQQAVIDLVRGAFTRREVADVLPYGGEFSAGEVERVSYSCPTIFVAVLGWRPMPNGLRLTGRGVRGVRMAAFVVTKHAKRDARMAEAMGLAERLALLLQAWVPADSELEATAPLEADCTVENLYSAAMDTKGQALWLVDWTQAVKTLVNPATLADLLAVEIEDTVANAHAPAAAPVPGTLVVTEDVKYRAD